MSVLSTLQSFGFTVSWRTVHIGWDGNRVGWKISLNELSSYAMSRLDNAGKEEAYHIVRLMDMLGPRKQHFSYGGETEILAELRPLADLDGGSDSIERSKWLILKMRQLLHDARMTPGKDKWEIMEDVEYFLIRTEEVEGWAQVVQEFRGNEPGTGKPSASIDESVSWVEGRIDATVARIIEAQAADK